MSTLFLSNSLVQAAGWTLIHSLWQGVLLGAIVLAFVARIRSPERRYLAFCLGMAALVSVLGITFSIQTKKVTRGGGVLGAVPVKVSMAQPVPLHKAIPSRAPTSAPRLDWNRVAAWVAWLWAGGVLAMSLRTAAAAWNVHSLRVNATPWHDAEWQSKLKSWLVEFGIQKPVGLAITKLNDVPAVIGHFKPLILLPAAIITRLSTELVEALILHELMHIRRNDFLANALQVVCETLLFFHPVAIWLSRSIRQEREHCCDDAVARRSREPLQYASALLSLEELRVHSPELLAVGAGSGSLKRRISRLLSPQAAPVAGGAGWTLSLCSVLLLASLAAWSRPKAESQPAVEQALFQIRMVISEGFTGDELPLFNAQPGWPSKLRVSKEVVLDNSHVTSAEITSDPISGNPQIMVTLNNEGAARFAAATRENVGRQAAIIVRGKIISAPRINEPITGNKMAIQGNLNPEELRELAGRLNPKMSEAGTAEKLPIIKLLAYFFELSDEPSQRFLLPARMDSIGDDLLAWKLTKPEALDLVARAKQSADIKLLSTPLITTSSGRAARVEIGAVGGPDNSFSVNATGYIINKDPAANPELALVGESLELLPELSRDNMIVAGRFAVRKHLAERRSGPTPIQTYYSAPFYVIVAKDGSLVLGQKSRAGEGRGENYLMLVIVPEVQE